MARKPAWEVRMDRAEARAKRSDARFDKWMQGCLKILQTGRQELPDRRRLGKKSDRKLKALLAAQKRTEASLRAFLASRRSEECPFCGQKLPKPSEC